MKILKTALIAAAVIAKHQVKTGGNDTGADFPLIIEKDARGPVHSPIILPVTASTWGHQPTSTRKQKLAPRPTTGATPTSRLPDNLNRTRLDPVVLRIRSELAAETQREL